MRRIPCRLGPGVLLTRPSDQAPPDLSAPPPRETHRRIRVRIDGATVVARIHQVVFNPSPQAQEALFLVPDPGPEGRVTLVGAEPAFPTTGADRLLDAATADGLTREWAVLGGNPAPLARQDLPARLLGPFRLPARGYLKLDVRTEARILAPDAGLHLLALSVGAWPDPPLSTHAIQLDLEDRWSGHVYSPSHRLREVPAPPGRVLLEPVEAVLDPGRPLVALWPRHPGRPGVALGSRDQEQALLVLVPAGRPAATPTPVPKRRRTWVIAVDSGGSLHGRPYQDTIATVDRILARLGPDDAFDVVAFSLDPHPLHRYPVPATPANRAEALTFLRSRRAWGAVNFEAGLLSSLEVASEAPPGSEPAVILLTDGRPTLGEMSARRILEQIPGKPIPILPVAYGPDVDYYFLEQLARQSGGAAIFEELPSADLAERLERLAFPMPPDPVRVRFRGRDLTLCGDRRVAGPRVASVAWPASREDLDRADPVPGELTVDGVGIDLSLASEAGVLPGLVHEWRSLGDSIWSALLGEARFPGGHWSFRLLGIVPGTPRPTILQTLRDGVGPLGRARVRALSGLLRQATFQPVPPAAGSAWSGNRFFEADTDGHWLESGSGRVATRRIGYGTPGHQALVADRELAPHLALGRSVSLLVSSQSAVRVAPGALP